MIEGSIYKNFIVLRDQYYRTLDRLWIKIPDFLGTIIATVLVFLTGATMRGDWLLILVHFIKQVPHNISEINTNEFQKNDKEVSGFSLEQFRLQGLPFILLCNLAFSYTFYFGLCGFLQWYFYVRQRENPELWKCQPYKNLPANQERHEITIGTINVGIGAIVFGTIACYIYNGGYSTLYHGLGNYGWTWLLFQIPFIFIWQDYLTYWTHRFMHTRYLYRWFHKLHHIYKQPTPFSVTSFHPIEFLFLQSTLLLPAFLIPLNSTVYVVNLLYIYYFGIVDHSGIVMDSIWPWQPDTIFHDNHHQYFNINFGFNLELWDKLYGTYRYIDNSLVGKTKLNPEVFRSEEETLRLEQMYMYGKEKTN